MFSTVDHFQTFKAGSVNSRRGALQIQTRESNKSIRITSNFTKRPRLEMTKDTVHIQNMQNSKMNIIPNIV